MAKAFTNWNIEHVNNLLKSGKIRGFVDSKPKNNPRSKKVKQSEKISYEKQYINNYLFAFCNHHGHTLETEKKVIEGRKFRFDWAIESIKRAVEYEGIVSKKSRHTTIQGYSKDSEKYNIALNEGWKVYRYTALTYKNIVNDFKL